MEGRQHLDDKLKLYGVGHRKLDDELFSKDKPPPRLGVYDFDDENLCHDVIKTTCNIPGCSYSSESLLEFENHYNALHRYCCAQCKKILPSPHFLDLHIQENHDSFFAVLAEKKPSYCCYIEECKQKFVSAEERREHCVKQHKFPKDFRFEIKPKNKSKKKTKASKPPNDESMEQDGASTSEVKTKCLFNYYKKKIFSNYTGRMFTRRNDNNTPRDVNMDDVVTGLRESLPE